MVQSFNSSHGSVIAEGAAAKAAEAALRQQEDDQAECSCIGTAQRNSCSSCSMTASVRVAMLQDDSNGNESHSIEKWAIPNLTLKVLVEPELLEQRLGISEQFPDHVAFGFQYLISGIGSARINTDSQCLQG
ncbi:hypothetical protein F0562_029719 [Nyssa sinensis]|uniref:Uncharacterized protein n=1 Tax=Nyssa sinensis TaxID=561372 RepID=A0A5J5B3F4_9ASTE|nr:hypothetical protein F0562_029719 [Nyssa sinensis]